MDDATLSLIEGTFMALNQEDVWFLSDTVFVHIEDMDEREKKGLLASLRVDAEEHRSNYLLAAAIAMPADIYMQVAEEIAAMDAEWWIDHTPLGQRVREDIEYGKYGPGDTAYMVTALNMN